MSKVVKSSRLILDDQAYQLAPPFFMPPEAPEVHSYQDEAPEIDHEQLLKLRHQQAESDIQRRLDEVEEDARQRLQAAEQDREAIIQEAYSQAAQIREDAYNEGYEAGQQQGFAEGRGISETLIQEALAVKAEIQERKEQTVGQIESETVRLIVDTVERILHKHVQEDYDLIHGIVKLAMERVTYTESVTLRVALEDFDMATSMKDQILALAENVDDIIIKQDKSLKPGSCVLDTTSGSIDSSIWTQFEQIKNTFEELLASE